MGDRRRLFPLVRSNRGYRRAACIRHIAPSAIGARRRRIGFLSSMLDHFVAVFLVVGLTSLLWLLPWFRWMPKGHADSVSHLGLSAPGMLQILEQRSAWGTCVGLFCMNYLLYFLLTWLP